MAIMYKHVVSLRLVFALVLLIEVAEMVNAANGQTRKKYFTENGKIVTSPGIITRQNRSNIYKEPKLHRDKGRKDINNIANVTAQTGSNAVLRCDTSKLQTLLSENMTVIWIRIYNDSFSILTDGDKVLTFDKRFVASNKTDPKDWNLHIRYTQTEDEGLYQCQICSKSTSDSSSSIYVRLTLIEARAVIIGGPIKEVDKVGAPLRLSCFLEDSIEAPMYIFWYHEDRMINYDLDDGATVRHGRQGSELIFPRAEGKHAGNYSCVPSNARQASVLVTIKSNIIPNTENKINGGKKCHPQDHCGNVLVLMSIFHLYNRWQT